MTLATERDHIVPLAEGGIDAAGVNEQGLCAACHREKTQAEALRARGGGKKFEREPAETGGQGRFLRAGVVEGGVS